MEFRTDKDILYIELKGRIDASNAGQAEEEIAAIRNAHEGLHTVLDADELTYISSAGLRVILRIRKSEPSLAIINVAADVYDVFEMTGFTDMIMIEKTYPRLSVEGCEFIAKGANGAVYRYDSETIVKQYFNRDSLREIKQERENARKAFVSGINTAIPYGIVRIGDGYGSVTELLNAKSISKIIRANPDDLDEPVAYFVDMVKQINSTEVPKGELVNSRRTVFAWVDCIRSSLPADKAEKLQKLVEGLPESKYMIHGDYHTNNVMVQNGEALIIDLDTLACGCPIIELASMYNAFISFAEVDHSVTKEFYGYDYETAIRFWRLSLARYFDTDDENIINDVENKAKVIGYTRMVRRCITRNLGDDLKNHYIEKLIEAIDTVDTLEI